MFEFRLISGIRCSLQRKNVMILSSYVCVAIAIGTPPLGAGTIETRWYLLPLSSGGEAGSLAALLTVQNARW